MTEARKTREIRRIRAGYYHRNNYSWQYVLQPGEDSALLCREVGGKLRQVAPFVPRNNWTDFICYKEGPAGGDCDASAAAMLTFQMAFPYLCTCELEPLPGKYQEYKLSASTFSCRGDTMTSGWTPLKRYLAFLHDDLKARQDPRFASLDHWVKIYAPGVPMTNRALDSHRSFRRYCYYHAAQLAGPVGQVLSEDCKLFLEYVWSQGNMLPVPDGFNTSRFSSRWGDTSDRLLVYLYYFIISGGNNVYLELLFSHTYNPQTRKKVIEATKNWISHICGETLDGNAWNTFVEIHCLQPFCRLENGVYLPICLFNGQPLQYPKPVPRQLKFLPDNLDECECLFRTSNRMISERSRLVQQRISFVE